MSIIFILIPVSILIAACFLGAFIWAVKSGQYEDTCTPSMRLLTEDASGAKLQRPVSPHPDPLPRGEGTACDVGLAFQSESCESSGGHSRGERNSILPLPNGEGRGEGEQDSQCVRHLGSPTGSSELLTPAPTKLSTQKKSQQS